MKITHRLDKIIHNPTIVLLLFSFMLPDDYYLSLMYRRHFGKKLDLKNPKTFNEKLQWLKLNNRKDIYTTMVDKYAAKDYVANIIGKDYIIPTIGVYDDFDDINFNKLPNQFIIKCTHDSGGLVICKDKTKLNIKTAKKKINKSLKRNFYCFGREWPYKNVKPRILIEEYMEDSKTSELRDYKFFCFNGKVEFFKIDFDRTTDHHANYYDKNGKLTDLGEVVCPPDHTRRIELPKKLNEMIRKAEILSKNIPFLRVDFYEVDQKIYFGEMTFYPAAGFGKFTNEEWNLKLGNMIDLSLVEKGNNAK